MNKSQNQSKTIRYDDHETYWYSYDLGLCAALLCLGFDLETLDRDVPSKVLFIFKRKPGIDKAADDYWSNRLEVKARTYFDNLKALKSRLRNS